MNIPHHESRARSAFAVKPLSQAVFLACLTLGLGTAALPLHAQTTQAASRYDIPAGPLDQALNRFAAQAGALLVIDGSLTAGKSSRGLSATTTVEDGFTRLLDGTGLESVKGDKGYALRRAAATAPAAKSKTSAEATLSEVTVTADAERETAWGPVRGYAARRSATATKTDTPIIETPQSISVVTADQMATLKPQSLGDAMAYTPGIFAIAGYSKSYDNFLSRGFQLRDDTGSVVRDGLKFGGSGWATGQQEPYGLERVEFLKGAASVMYGASAPGGVLNTVSKRPSAEKVNEVRAGIGNLGHREVAADLGGAAAPGSDWSWRLTALARKGDTHVDHIPNDAVYVAPALKWQPNASTSLTLLSYHHDRRTAYYYPLPAEGTLVSSPYGKLPRNRFVGEPGFDREDTKQSAIGWVFEHAFSGSTKFRHALRYIESENNIRFTGLDGWVDDTAPRAQFRTAYEEIERTSGVSTDTSIEHRIRTGNVTHTLLAGVDASRLKPESQWSYASLNPLDLFAPVYGAVPGPMTLESSYSNKFVQTRVGLYLQDQMKLGERWVVQLGGRQDWTRNANASLFGASQWSKERDEAFTGSAGAVYLADNGFAPFVSFSQSFQPQAGVDHNGMRFKPTTGEQFELGLRWQPSPDGMMVSASAYELTQQNVVTRDPAQPARRFQTGEVRARGFELEAKGRVGRHLNLIAAYAYTDARTTRSLNPAQVGQRTELVPYHQASVWADGELGALGWQGIKAGAGLRYVGPYSDVNGTGERVPDATLVDAMLGYTTGPWNLALNFANLGDKRTLACSYGDCTYGEGRRVTASVAYRW